MKLYKSVFVVIIIITQFVSCSVDKIPEQDNEIQVREENSVIVEEEKVDVVEIIMPDYTPLEERAEEYPSTVGVYTSGEKIEGATEIIGAAINNTDEDLVDYGVNLKFYKDNELVYECEQEEMLKTIESDGEVDMLHFVTYGINPEDFDVLISKIIKK